MRRSAGRTIVQIAPPAATGGDQRATLAVAEALIEAGARALIVSDPGELASEAQAVGALHVPFPASTDNPLAMMFNVRRLAPHPGRRAGRPRPRASRAPPPGWRSAPAASSERALVTSIPGEGPAGRPRTSFELAVAEGDLVVAASTYAAERAAEAFPAALTRFENRAAGPRRRAAVARAPSAARASPRFARAGGSRRTNGWCWRRDGSRPRAGSRKSSRRRR